jgi:hypothetical protein
MPLTITPFKRSTRAGEFRYEAVFSQPYQNGAALVTHPAGEVNQPIESLFKAIHHEVRDGLSLRNDLKSGFTLFRSGDSLAEIASLSEIAVQRVWFFTNGKTDDPFIRLNAGFLKAEPLTECESELLEEFLYTFSQ